MLQEDGRVSFRTIADTLDVSEGTVRNRVNWMKEAGQLAIVAIVDPASITYRSDAMLGSQNSASVIRPEEVAQRIGKHPQAVYILWVGGRFDLLIEVVVDAESELSDFMNEHVYKDPGIGSVEIMTGIQMFKNQFLLKRDFTVQP